MKTISINIPEQVEALMRQVSQETADKPFTEEDVKDFILLGLMRAFADNGEVEIAKAIALANDGKFVVLEIDNLPPN